MGWATAVALIEPAAGGGEFWEMLAHPFSKRQTGSAIECPRSVTLYSTCSGLAGKIVRVTMPSPLEAAHCAGQHLL